MMKKFLFPLAFLCLCFFACNTSKEVETKTSTVSNPIPLKSGFNSTP